MGHFHSLFLKPSLRCTANCTHCGLRRDFYRDKSKESLSLEGFIDIIRQARALGASSLHLSGGEPTLYPELADLIREASSLGLFTVLNTNGSLIDLDYAKRLLDSGLDSVIISIHSHLKEKHESIRARNGNFDEVLNAAKAFIALRESAYHNFFVTTQTIISKLNFRDLPGIIDLVSGLKVDAHGISYLEGDFEGENSLSLEDITEFKEEVLPIAKGALARHRFKNLLLKVAAISLLSRLYRGDDSKMKDMSVGIYASGSDPGGCRTPRGFAMVLADGSVLPCNMTEYTSGPVFGNVKESRLEEILSSDEWRDFADRGYDYCKFCPTRLHLHIPISAGLRKLLPLIVKNPAWDQKAVCVRIKEAF